jgi:hypothetical protein
MIHPDRSSVMSVQSDSQSVQSNETTTSTSSAISKIRDLLEGVQLHGFDRDAFVKARQADIDAISKATAVAFTGAQTITEKQAELLKATLGELNEALGSPSPASGESAAVEGIAKKQLDLVQSTLTRTLDDMKEMAEAAQRAQKEIFDIALERARSNAQELRALFVARKT